MYCIKSYVLVTHKIFHLGISFKKHKTNNEPSNITRENIILARVNFYKFLLYYIDKTRIKMDIYS